MCYEDRLAIISLACRSSVHIHTHTHLTALFPGLPDFTEARDSDWQWHQLGHMQTICTSLQRDNHASTYHSVFYRPDALAESGDLTVFFSKWPTNSVKALKAVRWLNTHTHIRSQLDL